jgi:hypothetical protein
MVIFRSKSSNRSCRFWDQNQETWRHRFWGQTRENRRPWFWGSTKKPMICITSCRVQTANSVTWPSDCPVTEYPTCATIPDPLHQVSYSCHDPHRCRYAAPAIFTPRDKETRFSKWNRDKGKTTKMAWIRIQISVSQWLITIKSRNWPLGFSDKHYTMPNLC